MIGHEGITLNYAFELWQTVISWINWVLWQGDISFAT